MDSIAEFINPAAAASPATTVGQARSHFLQAQDRHVLAVVEGGRPLGLVSRETCFDAADDNLALTEILDSAPPVLDAATSAWEACRLIAADPNRTGDGFLVCDQGLFLGAGSLRALIEGLGNAQAAHFAAAPFKQQFLDLISQELRTPLDGVLAMTECLERQPLAADAQSHVRAIRESGETLQRILAAAVDLSRAEQGLLQLAVEPVLLRSVIDDVQAEWSDRADRAGLTLLVSFEGDADLKALTDRSRLHQVFDRLIESAAGRTREGSIEVGLKAAVRPDGVHVEGRVRDTGPGLAPEKLARVFEADLKGGSEGALGVALARQIILGLNGCIRAESNVGAGVSMIFDFVCEAVPEEREVSPHADASPTGSAHILVVDDNATNRMVAEALCEMFDCTSECAVDGVEAVEIARTGRFDVVLMDIKMPRMDGMAATRAIRALGGPAGAVPIIALTANVDPEDARAYLASGMCSVVEKPIKPDKLLLAINEALASSAQAQSPAAAA